MASRGDTFYVAQYVGSKSMSFGIMLQSLTGISTWMDWNTFGFVQILPTPATTLPNLVQPLFMMTSPVIPGDLQRFTYSLNTESFADGNYGLYYVDNLGQIVGDVYVEYFTIYKGSANRVAPPSILVSLQQD